jgi:hypothetical protein
MCLHPESPEQEASRGTFGGNLLFLLRQRLSFQALYTPGDGTGPGANGDGLRRD